MQIDNYQKLKLLGEGTYGKCYLALNRQTGTHCVLKQIQIMGLTQEEISQSVREAHILQALDSDFIIKFLASFQSKEGYLNIVMAYAQGGDLSQRIKQARQAETPLSQQLILKWFTQACIAIKHVHDRKIIHRDLKAQNIFLTAEGEVKLGDFGIARHLQHTIQKTKSVVGTPYYMSPQICENKEYSFKADIWSLGVILLEMCLLRPPFDANSLPVLALKISKGEHHPVPKYYSKELRRLAAQILQVDPAKRPSINQVLRHPLIQPKIVHLMPRQTRERQFSHTTLHAINIFDKAPSRGLFLDCAIDNSPSPIQNIVSPKSVQPSHGRHYDMPVKRVDNYMKDQPKPADKKPKKDMRKREYSEPTLTPKGHMKIENQRKVFSKNGSAVIVGEKKRSKEGIFKKKSKNVDIIGQVEEIMSIKRQISDIINQQQYSHRDRNPPSQPQQDVETPLRVLNSDDLIEDGEEDEDEQCPITERQPPSPSLFQQKQNKQETLIQTLEALILQETNQADLQDLYRTCRQNDGICLFGPCSGLITLAFALRQEVS